MRVAVAGYRTIRRRLQPRRLAKLQAQDVPIANADLDRHFDVVHCMSGGFLQLYVLLRSGIHLNFSTLLFDSTPILPKPVAFTTFARAYMRSAGWIIPYARRGSIPRTSHTLCLACSCSLLATGRPRLRAICPLL